MDNVAGGMQTESKPPAEQARADLVRWCEQHGLPVPPKPDDHTVRAAQLGESRN